MKEVEDYKFAPEDGLRRELIIKWLRTPPLFAELLDKYVGGLPSDGDIKFDLIQRGFNPPSADSCVSIFRQSVEYAHYYEQANVASSDQLDSVGTLVEAINTPSSELKSAHIEQPDEEAELSQRDYDCILVRLSNGRRAWLQIPSPFYEADKSRLKAQIDLVLTDDEEEN